MRVKFFFIMLLPVLLVSCSKQDSDNIVWHMPTPYPEGVFHTQNIYQFVQDIQQLTDNMLSIRVHSGALVFKHPEIKRAVRTGQVQIGEILMSLLGNEDPLFQVDVLPLLATDYTQAQKLWQVSRVKIEGILEAQNLKLLFAVPWPPQGLYTKQKIESLEDMQGMKIRAYNAMLSRLVELMGGIPTTIQASEIPQAFSTGVIDAMMTSPSTGVSSQAWDYVEYYYDFQAWIPKNMVIVNKQFFDMLTPSLQDKVMQAAQAAEERGWKLSEKETLDKTKILTNHGIQVLPPSETLRDELRQIRQMMAEEWQNKTGITGEEVLTEYGEKY